MTIAPDRTASIHAADSPERSRRDGQQHVARALSPNPAHLQAAVQAHADSNLPGAALVAHPRTRHAHVLGFGGARSARARLLPELEALVAAAPGPHGHRHGGRKRRARAEHWDLVPGSGGGEESPREHGLVAHERRWAPRARRGLGRSPLSGSPRASAELLEQGAVLGASLRYRVLRVLGEQLRPGEGRSHQGLETRHGAAAT
mmetsp:Transcript_17322/g.58096  ORF Transcript_17322/g.58096 Transcript_17322/m.58096 type:complete len:203 (-) Transcript_17322:394-1002(-)